MCRLLIGYGNPLRCDDGVGWFIASQLAPIADEAGAQVISAHQLAPEMADAVSRASEVLFVDAAVGEAPGVWTVHPVHLNPQETLSSLVHHLTPSALLALSQILYDTAPVGRILTVAGGDFGYGETFSEAVEAILPAVQQYAVHFLQGDRSDANSTNGEPSASSPAFEDFAASSTCRGVRVQTEGR